MKEIVNMSLLTFLTFFSLLWVNNFSLHTNANNDVINLPFMALYKVPKDLHVITDKFVLTQTVNLKPLILHLQNIKMGFIKVKEKYITTNVTLSEDNISEETRLMFILEQAAQTITAGMNLLPNKESCEKR